MRFGICLSALVCVFHFPFAEHSARAETEQSNRTFGNCIRDNSGHNTGWIPYLEGVWSNCGDHEIGNSDRNDCRFIHFRQIGRFGLMVMSLGTEHGTTNPDKGVLPVCVSGNDLLTVHDPRNLSASMEAFPLGVISKDMNSIVLGDELLKVRRNVKEMQKFVGTYHRLEIIRFSGIEEIGSLFKRQELMSSVIHFTLPPSVADCISRKYESKLFESEKIWESKAKEFPYDQIPHSVFHRLGSLIVDIRDSIGPTLDYERSIQFWCQSGNETMTTLEEQTCYEYNQICFSCCQATALVRDAQIVITTTGRSYGCFEDEFCDVPIRMEYHIWQPK